MAVQPESTEAVRIDRVERRCPDCGRPIEPATTGKRFRTCRSCYDVYVDNAGR
jgi:hypothetical protein